MLEFILGFGGAAVIISLVAYIANKWLCKNLPEDQ